MKYKLINRATNEAHMCDKVTIDGLDYYVSDKEIKANELGIIDGEIIKCPYDGSIITKGASKVIATNNPSIDIPKVVDEVFKLAYKHRRAYQDSFDGMNECIMNDAIHQQKGFIEGYNKSQETHPNSDEDMIEFANWLLYNPEACFNKPKKELLELWKSQQPKVLYYQ